jgi:hypothetical protein
MNSKPEAQKGAERNLGRYRSGQTGQTVNLLAYAFSGSNPLLPIGFIRADSQVFKPFGVEPISHPWYVIASYCCPIKTHKSVKFLTLIDTCLDTY